MPSRMVLADREISVTSETIKVAVSAGPSGTVWGTQLAPVFQSLLVGLSRQVALPAWLLVALRVKARTTTAANMTGMLADPFRRSHLAERVDFIIPLFFK